MQFDQSQLAIVIMVRNEERHISRCLECLKSNNCDVFFLYSESTDKTLEICINSGKNVIVTKSNTIAGKINEFEEYAKNKYDWIMRIDADEYVDEGSWELIFRKLSEKSSVDGFYVKRALYYQGKRIRYGGVGSRWTLRIWRSGTVSCENRVLDEQILFKNPASHGQKINAIFHDNPLISINEWIYKHIIYSDLEVQQQEKGVDDLKKLRRSVPLSVYCWRFGKKHIYYRFPNYMRPILYFFVRYFLLLGFLDGRKGFEYNFLHALWYRMLVDIKSK